MEAGGAARDASANQGPRRDALVVVGPDRLDSRIVARLKRRDGDVTRNVFGEIDHRIVHSPSPDPSGQPLDFRRVPPKEANGRKKV